uniref:Appr-1-p processing domain protein n=1 Tax=Cyanothece sp. (strain PCC 7425 / ATCC 29141) TaxID=395961 RepID=B8HYS5_CYAP4
MGMNEMQHHRDPRFQVIQGDITTLEVEAIVNAANNELKPGGGVCGAIFRAAGYKQLQQACEQIGYCPTGEALITPGFNLPAQWIVHTVGPVYGVTWASEELLARCYRNCLQFAGEESLSSIAFPLISTGIYGFPLEPAAEIAIREILTGLSCYSEIKQVYLVCYTPESYAAVLQIYDRICQKGRVDP